MEKMLHISKIDFLLERKVPMDITFVKRSTGDVAEAKGVTVTSVYGEGSSCNIEFPNGEKRTIRKPLIQRIDNIKIFF